MDPRKNPYAPGAGTTPPQLSGRDEIIEEVSIQLDRCQNGLSHRGFLLVGLRGVGKTVLLNYLASETEAKGLSVIQVETPEKRSLPALLIPALRSVLLRLDRKMSLGEMGKKVLKALGSFTKAMKLKFNDIEFELDLETEPGLADSGDLENDLIELFVELGNIAKIKKTALVLFIDEIQYLEEKQFAALITALHKCAQKQLPVTLVGAGLPQLVGQAGKAKSYAERLFLYPQMGALNAEAAQKALTIPAEKNGVRFTKDALGEILAQTQGYPYFLQEWGKHCWQCAQKSPITLEDARVATQLAKLELDASFFRVRFDRLTPKEKEYLRALAELGPNNHRSGDVAQILGKEVHSVAPLRASLINKGMIYSPEHGETGFTVPLFDEYMKRMMPNFLVEG